MSDDISGEMARSLMHAISEVHGKQLDAQREILSHEINLNLDMQSRKNFAKYLSEVSLMQSAMLNTSVEVNKILSSGMGDLIHCITSDSSDISDAEKDKLIRVVSAIFNTMITEVGDAFSMALHNQIIQETQTNTTSNEKED